MPKRKKFTEVLSENAQIWGNLGANPKLIMFFLRSSVNNADSFAYTEMFWKVTFVLRLLVIFYLNLKYFNFCHFWYPTINYYSMKINSVTNNVWIIKWNDN